MKRDLVGILCCPACKGDLELTVGREEGHEVLEGTLRCARCDKGYPVEDGIPDLLPR